MEKITFVRDFANNDELRSSFNQLALKVFGISFEEWYQHGFWTEKYDPFSYMSNNQIIANVSVNKLDLIISGEKRRALQIGTVMTEPAFRNRGLSKLLMNKVLEEYEGQYDVMYLFANHTVLDFYPKFGFQTWNEYQYSLSYKGEKHTNGDIRLLDISNKDDLAFIYGFVKARIPVSQAFSTSGTSELLMFYCLYVFSEHIYYIPVLDVIVLYKQEERDLHLYDVVSREEVDLLQVLEQISTVETEKVIFHFTPNVPGLKLHREVCSGSGQLFVKTTVENMLPEGFKHPLTSQA